MAKKPQYSRFITSSEFTNKEQAESWAKKQESQYKGADMSVKFDISRTPNSTWRVSLFAKV